MARTANDAARATARALAARGMGTRQIVEELTADGVTVSQRQVRRWCEGLLPSAPGPRPRDVDVQAVDAAREDGATWREVEDLTGVPKSTAHRMTRKERQVMAQVGEGDTVRHPEYGLAIVTGIDGDTARIFDTLDCEWTVPVGTLTPAPGERSQVEY